MGRGRAKAKQTKVARELKYNSGGLDLDRLRNEIVVKTSDDADDDATDNEDDLDEDADDEADDDEDGLDDDPADDERWSAQR